MRSSKSRSRNKNRNRPSGGNVINRVFDSSGPEGKVRGTPQQVIDKYNQLARDAQLSGDRVATENFQQHAEHYTRLLAIATREVEARRDQGGGQNHNAGGGQGGGHASNQPGGGQQSGGPAVSSQQHGDSPNPTRDDRQGRIDARRGRQGAEAGGDAAAVIETGGDDGAGLVETPETRSEGRVDVGAEGRVEDGEAAAKPRRRTRRKASAGGAEEQAVAPPIEVGTPSVEDRPRRRPRAKAPVATDAAPGADRSEDA